MPPPEQRGYDDHLVIRYLLGSTSEEETERLDELSIADDEFVSKLSSAENDLVDAYVRGELEGETLERFKSFYLASPSRLEKVEFATVLQTRTAPLSTTLAAPQESRKRAAGERALAWAFAGIAALLLAIVGYLALENRRLQTGIAQEQARRSELEQRAQALQQQLENESASTRTASEPPPEPPSGQPILAFVLPPQTRGAAAIASVTPPSGTGRVALQLILETDDFRGYRVKLRDPAANQIIWRSEGLKAQTSGAKRMVSVVLPVNLLKQQNYTLELTGIPPAGAEEFVASYAFKVGN
jgi:hypothetical protein